MATTEPTLQALNGAYRELQQEAERLAGGLADLQQRATVYHHLYHASGGNHVFPLIAAHGALWAGGYFRYGRRLSQVLCWQFPFSARRRQALMQQLETFEDALRDINRRVCVDTYLNFHLTDRLGTGETVRQRIPAALADALAMVHQARRQRCELSAGQRRFVFEQHFLHEQENVVGPAVQEATAALDWPLVRALAMRPSVRFAYFPAGVRLAFRNFADRQERIRQGLQAFDIGAELGWAAVAEALEEYDILPREVFTTPAEHFVALRAQLLPR